MRYVAIHGLGCSASQGWPRVAGLLSPGHELVALALHGADGTTDAPPSEWGIRAQAARLAAHVRRDDILVGHSMGGTIAIRVAEISPPRALVLIEPHVVPRAGFVVKPTLEIGPHPSPDAMAGLLRKMERIETGEGSYARWIARWDWRVFHAMSRELANGDGAAEARRGADASAGASSARAWIDALRSFAFPVHVVWGGESDDAGEDVHGDALRALGLPFHVVEESKHFIPSEAPEGLADVLARIRADTQANTVSGEP